MTVSGAPGNSRRHAPVRLYRNDRRHRLPDAWRMGQIQLVPYRSRPPQTLMMQPLTIDTYTRQSLVQRLLGEPMFVEATHGVLGALAVAMLWNAAPHTLLLTWVFALDAATVARYYLRRYYATRQTSVVAVPGLLRIAIVVVGLCWGIGAFTLAPIIPNVDLALLMVIMCGVCAAGTASLLADRATYRGFLVAMLAPLALGMLRTQHMHDDMLALAMVVLFGAGMLMLHGNVQEILIDLIRTTFTVQSTAAVAAREREFLESLIQTAPSAVAVTDASERLTRINPAFESMFGYSPEEAIGRRIEELIVPADDREAFRVLREHVVAGGTIDGERVRHAKSGQLLHVRAAASPLAGAGGTLILYSDITEQKIAERHIRESEDRLFRTLDSLPAGIVVVGVDGSALLANARARDLLGPGIASGPSGDDLACTYQACVAGTDRVYPSERNPLLRALHGERVVIDDMEIRRPGGSIIVEVSGSPITDSEGDVVFGVATFSDITERQRLERRNAARNAVVAVLAEATDESSIIAGMLHAVCEELGWDIGSMWHVDAATELLRNAGFWCRPGFDAGESEAFMRTQSYARGVGLAGCVLADPRPLWVEDLSVHEPPFVRAAAATHLRAALGLPVRVAGAIVGVIELFSAEARPEDGAMIEMLAAIASQVGNAVERRRAEVALREARDAAEQATTAKSAFLAHMSHEIRTPLNGILGMAELLLDGSLTADDRRGVELIATSGESLLAIIDAILDFSKIEAEQLTLEVSEFELPVLIESSTDLMATRAANTATEVFIDVDPSTPRFVIGDPTRLRQVLNNLIGNAIKFTPRGNVVVRATRGSSRDDVADIMFSVRDTGIGIQPDQLASIFEPFRQADASTTRKFGGTGLGLSICRRLVMLMGGDLQVHSTPGAGSNFTFTLPLRLPPRVTTPRSPRSVARPRIERAATARRVLLAEDNAVNQEVASRMLRRRGHVVDIVGNGREAVEAVARGVYDVVLMDVQMPELDGLQATRAIRTDAPAGRPRIIAVTANATSAERDRCLAAGMDGYLSKPFRPADLFAAVETGDVEALPTATPELEMSEAAIDLDALQADLAAAQVADILPELLESFERDAPCRLEALERAVAAGDAAEIERTAHAYKSPSSTIYARPLATLLGQIEATASRQDSTGLPALLVAVQNESRRVSLLLSARRI